MTIIDRLNALEDAREKAEMYPPKINVDQFIGSVDNCEFSFRAIAELVDAAEEIILAYCGSMDMDGRKTAETCRGDMVKLFDAVVSLKGEEPSYEDQELVCLECLEKEKRDE